MFTKKKVKRSIRKKERDCLKGKEKKSWRELKNAWSCVYIKLVLRKRLHDPSTMKHKLFYFSGSPMDLVLVVGKHWSRRWYLCEMRKFLLLQSYVTIHALLSEWGRNRGTYLLSYSNIFVLFLWWTLILRFFSEKSCLILSCETLLAINESLKAVRGKREKGRNTFLMNALGLKVLEDIFDLFWHVFVNLFISVR